ncbi:MAG: response regulator transcription factor [Alphaproteobacteria bacterium]|nr:response regulator transcription factor [Alphaproteobacteria bacterium]
MPEQTGPILVVDDEADIRSLLTLNLKREGFAVVAAENGQEAIRLAQQDPPILVVLDLMLPDLQGTEVCRRLRTLPETQEVPIVMLTARGEEIDRVVGFEVGADDYVTKPFSVRELMLRIRAILRRAPTRPEDEPDQETLTHGPLRIDAAAHRVWVNGEEIQLTATEFKLLMILAQRIGRVQSRGQLLQDVWEMPPDLNTRTVDTHVKRLREKLGDAAALVETVRGVGYRFAR